MITPRLNQCYLCKTWDLEERLSPIEIPDQGASYVRKMACKGCLDALRERTREDIEGGKVDAA